MMILFPDHTAAIAGSGELIHAFAKHNGMVARGYALSELQAALKANDRAWLELQREKGDVALFFVPTTVRINADMLDFCGPSVRAFATASTGTDHVDLGLLMQRSVPFIYAPGENSTAVVEYVLSALPLLFDPGRLLGGELSLGIVGYGRVGGLLGRVAHRLGFRVRAFDPFVLMSGDDERKATLASQVVSFHLPLTSDGPHPTEAMIDESWIQASAPGTVWINTGRGPVFPRSRPEILEASLERFRTVYDVFPEEPARASWIERSAFATPHVAGYTWRGRFMGVFRVLSDYASAAGLSMPFQPSDFRPAVFEISGPSFLARESAALKENPASFSHRRNNFPSKSSFRDDLEVGVFRTDTQAEEGSAEFGALEQYYHRLADLWNEMRL